MGERTDHIVIPAYAVYVTECHNKRTVVIDLGYPVAGVGAGCGVSGGGIGAAAFALVLFVLLVIILRAGY
ncbi:hypothetical protein KCTCHS21_23090 [Cohnella abietis]|uniref:Sporulation protein YjcZ n=1 Tax=Cohnella abietis TaxID=2507935 RepID=A0A3T1D470_9BACL|nr:hypothetical protein KCTCHS21_23090 [Cohnella abietis]